MALNKEQIAQRIARELRDGYYVNLGIGIPTLVANYIPEGMNVVLQSENGLLGMGPFPIEGKEDPDLINAGKQTITTIPGSAFFDSATRWRNGGGISSPKPGAPARLAGGHAGDIDPRYQAQRRCARTDQCTFRAARAVA